MRKREEALNEALAKADEKQRESEQFSNAIFETCNLLEFSPEASIVNVNDNLCKLFNADSSMFIGKHLSLFIGEEAFHEVKENIRAGKIFEAVHYVPTGDGKTKPVVDRFVPILDKYGVLIRVMMLAFPDDSE
jgi:PAS domain S-box-containing protein